jgi:hypothetical protein
MITGARKYPKGSPTISAKTAKINIFPSDFLLITAIKAAMIETLIATAAVTIMSIGFLFLLVKFLPVDFFVNFPLTLH